jgi:sugar/nucleoside kinase (ribokinase family)
MMAAAIASAVAAVTIGRISRQPARAHPAPELELAG